MTPEPIEADIAALRAATVNEEWPTPIDVARLSALLDYVEGMRSGPLGRISAEREAQTSREGYDASHDDVHIRGELASAAATYALPHRQRDFGPPITGPSVPRTWPWSDQWKPSPVGDFPNGRLRELEKAGALIVAEMERIERLPPPPVQGGA